MRTIKKNCLHCGKEFDAPVKEVNRGFGKCCDRACSSKYVATLNRKDKVPNVTCANCGKAFYKLESRQRYSKSGLFFCTRECKDSAQQLGGIEEIMPPHYGTGTSRTYYRQKLLRRTPSDELRCSACGYHKMPEILEVHHIDHDHTNNMIDNLVLLCPNCHSEHHFTTKTGKWTRT